MRRIIIFTFLSLLFFVSCSNDDMYSGSEMPSGKKGLVFNLKEENFEGNGNTRSSDIKAGSYDNLFFYIADEDGEILTTARISYDTSTSEIYAEGLHEGDYRLLVLGVRGDYTKDKAVINDISDMDETWLAFPADMVKPLDAEYFYSQLPFTVRKDEGGEIADINMDITLKRLVGRLDIDFIYNNRYVENATVERLVIFSDARLYTSVTGGGNFGGETESSTVEIPVDGDHSFLFMPTVEGGNGVSGEIIHTTVNYKSEKSVLDLSFNQKVVRPNNIHSVETRINHPDDKSPVMFVTKKAYDKSNHSLILGDSETKDVYTNRAQRSFNTSKPLQLSVTDDGMFHVRFYSPKVLHDATIKARIPSISNEFFEFAYFDSIPAFCDFYETTPMVESGTMCRLESGRYIEVPKLDAAQFTGVEFKVESSDPYLQKIKEIKHGWNIYWGLYGGDPDREDGGPKGNWMGIRPVHCRESVAFFLNFTYMIDMQEHEQILIDNAEQLYDDSGKLVKVDEVLKKMRQERTLQVGLVYTGNGVIGLGSGSVFGAYQDGWFYHYSNTYACSVMFHELGHVMGYGHSSSFTYGPWAEKLMNNFYVNNLKSMPVDSPSYLNSPSNINKYWN